MELNLRDKLRTGHVRRWNMVRVAREQTVAEHLYRVWLIARELYPVVRQQRATDRELYQVEQYALLHDIPEVITGDIPTPIKRLLEARAGEPDFLKKLDSELSPEYAQMCRGVKDTPIEAVVKIADLMETVYFLMVEGMGAHANKVGSTIFNRMVATIEEAEKKFNGQGDWYFEYAKTFWQEMLDLPDQEM